jgi:tRNA(Ile)-lysidine synthase
VTRLSELVTDWHGQRWIDLPGGVRASRRSGQVWFAGAAGIVDVMGAVTESGRDDR